MVFEFIRHAFLKTVRSAALGRNVMSGLITIVFVFFILLYVIGIAVALGPILNRTLGAENVIPFLNTFILYFIFFELLYRYFFQKQPTFDLQSYLHLPIKRSTIIHFLLARSLISPFSLVVILLFVPITISDVNHHFGAAGAAGWLLTLFVISITMHWFILWYKHRLSGRLSGTFMLVVPVLAAYVLVYFEWLVLGEYTRPFFDFAMQSFVPVLIALAACALSYFLVYRYYVRNAYLESGQQESSVFHVSDKVPGFFSRFGLAGEIADTELKLILRHKKSRGYLVLAVLLLFYGLLFYPDGSGGEGMEYLYLFVGIFITGAFFLQYGQLFLSWNSANFDFYMNRKDGLEALVRGKWLLFVIMATVFYVLSLAYAWFGWEIAAIHTAGFLYNIGIGVHMIIYIALWEPKPMDIGKGAMFNYDGVGMAQFLMVIPYIFLPYLIYVPIRVFVNEMTGLFVLAIVGVFGLIFNEKLLEMSVNRVRRNKYTISSTFRQEL